MSTNICHSTRHFPAKVGRGMGWAFVDYFESAVRDGSIFRIVIAKPVKVYSKCYCIALTMSVVIDPYCVHLLTG